MTDADANAALQGPLRRTISRGTAPVDGCNSTFLWLSHRAQQRMDNDPGQPSPIRRLTQWAITPPQSYGVYLGGLILVLALSFYAGTLRPKHVPAPSVTAPSAPRS